MKTSNRKIIDNFLDPQFSGEMKEKYCGCAATWRYNDVVVDRGDKDHLYNFQFTNTVYDMGSPKSDDYMYILPIFDKLGVKIPIRVKFNLRPFTPDLVKSSFHTDISELKGIPYKTAIYYINSNNGYTEFEDGERVESVSNRMLIFDGNQSHRGVTCTNEKIRVVLNINYF